MSEDTAIFVLFISCLFHLMFDSVPVCQTDTVSEWNSCGLTYLLCKNMTLVNDKNENKIKLFDLKQVVA